MTGKEIRAMLEGMVGKKSKTNDPAPTQQQVDDILKHPQFPLIVQEVNNIIAERENGLKAQFTEAAKKLAPQNQAQPQRPQYDREAFIQGLEKDGISGIDYLFQTYYGFNPATVIPNLVQQLQQTQQLIYNQQQQQVFGEFISRNRDFNPKNKLAVQEMHNFVSNNGLPATPDVLSAAWTFIKTQKPDLVTPLQDPTPQGGKVKQMPQAVGQNPNFQPQQMPNGMNNPNTIPNLQNPNFTLPPQFNAPGVPSFDDNSGDDAIDRMQAHETFNKLSLPDQRKFIDYLESTGFGQDE